MIGFGQIDRETAEIGTQLDVEWNDAGDVVRATVVDVPFMSRQQMYSG